MLHSMVETAKANGLTPFDYLQHCLEKLALNPANLEHLLPWNVTLA
jgi:transposase